MSRYARAEENANAALLVNVDPRDFGSDDVLAGVSLQRHIEQTAFAMAQKYHALPYPGALPTRRRFFGREGCARKVARE